MIQIDNVNGGIQIGEYKGMSKASAAKYLGVSLSKFNVMIAKSRAGILKPKLKWIRIHDSAPYIFRKEDLDDFISNRFNA